MQAVPRPQPIGVFPLPAGYLLVPSLEAEAAAELVAGRLPREWPASMRGHALAHAGDLPAACAAFSSDDPVSRFNRYVLQPDGVDVDELRACLPVEVRPLVDLVRYAIGDLDVAPEADTADGEIAACVIAAQASGDLAASRPADAVARLHQAAALAEPTSPVLAGLLLGNAGVVAHEHGLELTTAVADLSEAVARLDPTDLNVNAAEAHFHLGALQHEMAADSGEPLGGAVHHYYAALQRVDEHASPVLWASVHLNLATAYLTMPMTEASDQLRTGIAIQSLRAALGVFTREAYPSEWSSAQLNLANALVYQPSVKQGDNLVEAVELYEEVLAVRGRESDPMGRARLLTNQGNALAHLGIFDHAKAKLVEARYLFEEQGDHDAVMTVRSVLDEIARQKVPTDLPAVAER